MKELELFDHVVLNKSNIRLIPLSFEHESGLMEACKDGQLWKLRVTSTPHYSEVHQYIETALIQKQEGTRYPFVVIEENSGKILGTTSYHDVLLNVKRLEIGVIPGMQNQCSVRMSIRHVSCYYYNLLLNS